MTRVIVVGSGLTGLFVSIVAARRGASVSCISEGNGGVSLSAGCIDIWSRASPSRALGRLRSNHPYNLTGTDSLKEALAFFSDLLDEYKYPFSGSVSRNYRLPTSMGTIHTTAYAPLTMVSGDLSKRKPITLANFGAGCDFYPNLVSSNLRRSNVDIKSVVDLKIEIPPIHNQSSCYEIALAFDQERWRHEVASRWKPSLVGQSRLGVPAVLGLNHAAKVHSDLQEYLDLEIFEIPTLPPSIPGLRIERILRRALLDAGVNFIEGVRAIGRVDGRTGGRKVSGVAIQTPGGQTSLDAEVVILATGGVLNGGLRGRQNGRFVESVFDLPILHLADRARWLSKNPFHQQPYAFYGLKVNRRLQPLGADDKVIYRNLFAAGGILAGADRAQEGSRQGIDLATAYKAVDLALR